MAPPIGVVNSSGNADGCRRGVTGKPLALRIRGSGVKASGGSPSAVAGLPASVTAEGAGTDGGRQRPILQRRRRHDADLAVAAALAEAAERPGQEVAAGGAAGEPQAGELARRHQAGDVEALVGRLEAGDAGPHRIAERLHREVDVQAPVVEAGARPGHLEAIARPDERAFHAGEAPVVEVHLEAGETAGQLAAALEDVVRAGELALAGECERVPRPEDGLRPRKVDARTDGVRLLRPARGVDFADGVRDRAIGQQVDALEGDLAAVDAEASAERGRHRLEARDLDDALVERRGAAVGVRLADHHLEVRRDDRPRRATILQLEGASRRPDRPDGGDEALRSLRPVAGELREIVPAVLVGLDRHVPVGDFDVLDDEVAADDGPPRHLQRDPLGGEERAIAGRQAADAQVADDEAAAEELGRQAADVELALEKRRAAALRQAAQRRAEIDAEDGDETDGEHDRDRGEDGAYDPPQAVQATAAGNVCGRVGRRVGRLESGLG